MQSTVHSVTNALQAKVKRNKVKYNKVKHNKYWHIESGFMCYTIAVREGVPVQESGLIKIVTHLLDTGQAAAPEPAETFGESV